MLDLTDSEAIYKKIDDLRTERGWSVYELAKKALVSPNTIYHWRDRKSSPSLALLSTLCEALEIQPINLFLDTDELHALTEEQKELIKTWGTLSGEQKDCFIKLMKSITRYIG